jgi:GTP 3',8-cyclase
MDKYNIDSHKLHYHVKRVHDWLAGKTIAPIYIEISPSGACNHRCVFCALDFMDYRPSFLETQVLEKCLAELAKLGLKSVMFAGEGEPLLHKDITQISQSAHRQGLDIALTTNGVLFDEKRSSKLLPVCSWIKVSCNAGSSETYNLLHRGRLDDFNTVFSNLEVAVKIRQSKGYFCTLGLQMLLLPENQHEVLVLAKRCRDTGLDYLIIKPYSQHPQSKTRVYEKIRYDEIGIAREEVESFATESFSVIYREQSMNAWDAGNRSYNRCLALPFWSYLDSRGNIYGCSMHLNDDRFCYGNIYHNSMAEIWHGEKRKESLVWVANHLDPHHCRVNCRMDKINDYLWSLTHPPKHVNFI